MTIEYLSKEIFAFFYEKVYKQPCPIGVYNSDRAVAAVEDFAERLRSKYKKSVGANYVYNYILFHFGRYYDKIKKGEFKTPSGRMTMSLVFGAKPHQVFEDRNVKMDFMLEKSPLILIEKASKQELIFKKGIDFEERKATSVHTLGARGRKDPIKAISASGENPLDTCRDMTDLYDPLDGACLICPAQIACKALLREQLPALYARKCNE